MWECAKIVELAVVAEFVQCHYLGTAVRGSQWTELHSCFLGSGVAAMISYMPRGLPFYNGIPYI